MKVGRSGAGTGWAKGTGGKGDSRGSQKTTLKNGEASSKGGSLAGVLKGRRAEDRNESEEGLTVSPFQSQNEPVVPAASLFCATLIVDFDLSVRAVHVRVDDTWPTGGFVGR
jgi:hypothetical protein